MNKLLLLTVLGLSFSANSYASSVSTIDSRWIEFTYGWQEESLAHDDILLPWIIEDNNKVIQTRNTSPTVFYEKNRVFSDTKYSGTTYSGQLKVLNPQSDMIGFVIGYQPDAARTNGSDFWLMDWNKTSRANNPEGLSLSHVTGASTDNLGYLDHTAGVTEVQRAANLGSTGWMPNTAYNYDLTFTPDLINLYINDELELSLTAAAVGMTTFTDGSFGFYNNNLGAVYSLDKIELFETPVPAAAWLFMPVIAGFFGFKKQLSRKKS